jgi:hypothetical protein
MNILKKLFGFKEKEQTQEIQEKVTQEPIQQIKEPTIRGECWWCKTNVYEDERYAKQQGKLFHKKCYKEAKSQARGLNMG